MASAGLLRILHSGLQDERLLPPKGQPRTDVFEKTFVKAGRFTTELYRVDFDNRPAFGGVAKATVPRRGHLVTRAYLVTQLPDLKSAQDRARAYCQQNGLAFAGPTFGWTNSIGNALVAQLQLQIGTAPITTMDGRLMEVLDEFHTPLEKVTTVNRLLGRHDNNFGPESNQGTQYITPLPLFFGRGDPSAALPIDALGNDLVQISVTFAGVSSLYTTYYRVDTPVETCPGGAVGGLSGASFYYVDENGERVYGLDGNTEKFVTVSKVPGAAMPETYELGPDTYLLLEYVYLDKPEANRIRLGDLTIPIVQHYTINPYDTKAGTSSASIPLRIPNPTKDIYFYCHRKDADQLNAPFLATRDLSGAFIPTLNRVGPVAPWWPDASGLNTSRFLPLVPAYSQIDSEPLTSFALMYEGRIVRYATGAPAYFRSILPSHEQRKTPWHWKYYYHLPFGTQHEFFGTTQHSGEANLDKIPNVTLQLEFQPFRGSTKVTDTPSYTIYIWAETYNILRVYGGRGGLLFKY